MLNKTVYLQGEFKSVVDEMVINFGNENIYHLLTVKLATKAINWLMASSILECHGSKRLAFSKLLNTFKYITH